MRLGNDHIYKLSYPEYSECVATLPYLVIIAGLPLFKAEKLNLALNCPQSS